MGDIAWVRKYRPVSFDDYMGDNVKNLVVNRFKDRDNIPNTIMLYGTRGTGKTSMARLLAKEIHCMSPIDGHSCGKCEMCNMINEYISSTEAGVECMGITEVDAATTTGKNDINDIIDEAIIPPIYPLEYKILILDECHMLSKSAQNSLLKVMEEPPKHLIFILCTTDPDQVIGTIHSRIQLKLEVRKKSVDEMADKLIWIAEQEKFKISPEAAKIIAKKGERIPRECINILETIYKNFGEVTVDTVRKAVNDVSTDLYAEFFEAANSSLENILLFNRKLKDNDINIKQFVSGLIRFMLDACYIRYGINIEDYSVEFVVRVKRIFDIYKANEYDLALQIMEDATKHICDDDTKNELIMTTTALRVGKVPLLAKTLGNEAYEAEKENSKALLNYSSMVEAEENKKFERIQQISASKEALGNVFKQMTEVKDSIGIIDNTNKRIELIPDDTYTEGDENESNGGDSSFLSKDELNKLMS